MEKLIKKISIFITPFLILGVATFLIDPYNYFNIGHIIPSEIKAIVSNKVNYRLWKMTQFKNQPQENILLGDSRMILLKPESIKEKTGEDYFNFAYGGGSLEEAIETFWYADSITRLSNVYIGINFHLFNDFHRVNEAAKVRNYFENPFLYLVDKVVIKAGFLCFADHFFGIKTEIEKPDMTKEQFWRYQLDVSASAQFKQYGYPEDNYKKLSELVAHCNNKGINTAFIIFPEHVDLINRYYEFGLKEHFNRFKKDISKLAETFDYDYENKITISKENFTDPYHFNDQISQMIIDDIW